ncbi:MAG TPA: tripartite tricarboxylate transporter TctB family protein [Thermodesulfobacteriota bacterium]|nr:tripartite tricarboxylate transporter TctB family protein [Thermodesulfobacteriota bacterium]
MNAERVGGLFWLAFGLAVVIGSIHLGLGTLQAPGSGFLSFSAGIFLLIMAVLVIVHSYRKGESQETFGAIWKKTNWRRPTVVSILMLFYILTLEWLGFFLTSFIALLFLFRWVEKASWKRATLIPLGVTVFAYLLFHTMLNATLPQGIFSF